VGRPVPHRIAPRRPGDVATLVADIRRAREILGWRPSRSSIARIVADAAA
jgi:UDP-glucose 4-epimerase